MTAVTVVIPVYNVEKYLATCVNSVINQTFKDCEIILVDDGSTDKSGAICDEYKSKYDFISVIHQKNKGLGGARNTGIKAAKGEYVLLLDSDDYIDEHCLEICIKKAIEYNCDMVAFNQQAVYDDKSKGVIYDCPIKPNSLSAGNELKPLLFFCGSCNRIYKTKLFFEHNIKFPEKVWYEDLRTIPKMLCYVNSVYYYAEKPLYYYLQRANSIMHTPDFNRIATERNAAANEIWDYYIDNGYFDEYSMEIKFLMLYHGFFLPAREIQSMTNDFGKYIDELRNNLDSHFDSALQNKYISLLNRKEKMLLKWAYNRNYFSIKMFSAINKLYKKVRNVK